MMDLILKKCKQIATVIYALGLVSCIPKSTSFITQQDVDLIVQGELDIPHNFAESVIDNKNLWLEVSSDIIENSGVYAGIEDIGNDDLLKYIDKALLYNFDLQSSSARLLAVFEDIDIASSALFPQIDADVSGSKTQVDNNGVTQYNRNYRADLNLSWELDVWGKLNDARQVASYTALEQTMLYAAARNSLMVNVSKAWTDYIFAEEVYGLAQSQLKSLEVTLEIVESNYRVGLSEASDVYLTRSNLESQKIVVEQAKQSIDLAAQNFYVLIGEYPKSEISIARQTGTIPAIKPLQKVLPSELLLRRPDILSAHYNYLSSLKDLDAKTKEQYPSFSLNASIGTEDEFLKRLVKFDDALWSILAGVSQPIFNADRIDSNIKKSEFLVKAARADYFSTMLTAFLEVESALTQDVSLNNQSLLNESALQYARFSLRQNRELYNQGLQDVVTVLSSERQVFDTEINRLNIINQQIQNRLDLYLALGGDFYKNEDWLKEFSRAIFDERSTDIQRNI